VAPGQFLQLFVGIGNAVAAHHGLDRLGQQFPVGIQVRLHVLGPGFQLAQALEQGIVAQEGVTQAHPHVAQHGGVGQIPLPAGDRQLFRQVTQHRVGQAQIAFGIFEVDGIDLVGHGGRAHFPGLDLLFEEAQGNVTPHVPVQVDEDGVGPGIGVKKLRHGVVGLDLDGVGIEFQPQTFHKALGEAFPVKARVGGQVGVVVAHRPVDLGGEGDPGNAAVSPAQAIGAIGHFLTQGGRRSRLAVGTGHHGHLGQQMGQLPQPFHHLAQGGQQHLFPGRLEHQGVGQVVDILGSAGEVDEFPHLHHFLVMGQALLDPVFQGLHVMVGDGLDFLHFRRLFRAESPYQGIQFRHGGRGKGRNFGEMGFGGQGLKPFDFHLQAAVDQPVFGKLGTQGIHLGGVAAVQGRQGCKSSERHE